MIDPLDAVFISSDTSRAMKIENDLRRLADYLAKMPNDLKPLFKERFELKRPNGVQPTGADAPESKLSSVDRTSG